MLFPTFHDRRDQAADRRATCTRFDLDFDLPEHLLPEFPPAIFLTTRPDLGDVSQGKLVTTRQLLRALQRHPEPQAARGPAPARHAVPAAAVQRDGRPAQRRSRAWASPASTATPTATPTPPTHLVGDIRPQEFRHRIDTPTLRGVNMQRLFGSQRALKSVEDFTEFEQRAAYFDGDPVIATKKGVNILERGSQVHFMAEFQELLDFPPAPKLDVFGQARPAQGHRGGAARPGALLRQGAVRDLPRRRRTTPTT